MLDRLDLILLEDDVDDFIEDHAEEILIEVKPIKDILDEDDSTDLTEDELHPYIEKLMNIFEHLLKLIKNSNDNYTLPITLMILQRIITLRLMKKRIGTS